MVIVYLKGEMNAVTFPDMSKDKLKDLVKEFPMCVITLMNTKLEVKKVKGHELSFEEEMPDVLR